MKLEAKLEIPVLFLFVPFEKRPWRVQVWSIAIAKIIISRKYPSINMGSTMFMVVLNVLK